MLKIAIGADHGGFELKEQIVAFLKEEGHEVLDVGTNSKESCHYPVFAKQAAALVANKDCDYGVLICTTGEGIMMAANKIKGIRCGIGYNDESTELMRKHNDANMISFGAKFTSIDDAKRRILIFLSTEFEGGRHQTRVDLIKSFEN